MFLEGILSIVHTFSVNFIQEIVSTLYKVVDKASLLVLDDTRYR